MLKSKQLLLILLISCHLGACKYMAFTDGMHKRLAAGGVDLKQVQFYNSKPFKLRRVSVKADIGVDSTGAQNIKSKMLIELIKIKKYTPAVCDSVAPDGIYLSFEPGKDKSIFFKITDPNRLAISYYNLYSEEWIESLFNYKGKAIYKGKEYDLIRITKKSRIAISRKQSFSINKDIKTLDGVKVGKK